MSDSIIVCLVIIFNFYQPVTTTQDGRNWKDIVTKDVSCLENGMINNIFGISIDDCADECLLRNRCESILYHQGVKRCSLLDSSSNIASTVSSGKPTCTLVSVIDWTKQHLGKCSKNPCDNATKCTIKDGKCYAAECGKPKEVANAKLLSNIRSVGSKNAYHCDAGYFPNGRKTITCQSNGNWSVANLRCINECPMPKQTNNSHIVFNSTDDYSVGTILRYECNDTFVMPREENITAECQPNGQWSLVSVPCCRQGFQLAPAQYGNYCYRLFHDNVTNSLTEMRGYCTSMDNAKLSGFTDDLKSVFEQNPALDNIVVDYTKGKWIYEHMKKCINRLLEFNNVVVTAPQVTGKSFDELAEFVRSSGWASVPHCSWVNLWADEEPDGGYEMNCSYVPRSTMPNLKLYDIPCTWNSTQFNGTDVGFICYEERQLI